MISAGFVHVGRFGAAQGLKGEVRLLSFTQEPKAIAAYSPLCDAQGTRNFAIQSLRPAKGGRGDLFVARVAGIDDRNAAEALVNLDLYVPRARLPELAEDGEFYQADLLGLAVVDGAGVSQGRVVAIHNFGAGDIVEIAPESGATLMLPFTRAVVPHIDISAGHIVVVLPADETEA